MAGTKQKTAEHTPGPWRIHEDANGDISIFGKHGKDSTYVCEIGCPDDENAMPDAQLIAAAPEMLDFLKDLNENMTDVMKYAGWLNDLQEIIAKAEGKNAT